MTMMRPWRGWRRSRRVRSRSHQTHRVTMVTMDQQGASASGQQPRWVPPVVLLVS